MTDSNRFRRLPYKALVSVEEEGKTHTKCEFKHPLSGRKTIRIMPVTLVAIKKWTTGATIKKAMPNLTANERKLFLTGENF